MGLFYKSVSYNISHSFLGKVRSKDIQDTQMNENKTMLISLVDQQNNINCFISDKLNEEIIKNGIPFVLLELVDEFEIDDILLVSENNGVSLLFSTKSRDNVLFFSENCNHNCIMCAQPPSNEKTIAKQLEINYQLISFLPEGPISIGITGGEPTLFWNDFIEYIKTLLLYRPLIDLQILTNGRSFSDIAKVKEVTNISSENIVWGIPLYSDYFETHDYIVGAQGAFYDTLRGIYNLAKYRHRIEIRTVILKNNYPRLRKYANFLYKNMPFIEHIAFMGLEPTGLAKKNYEEVWVDPLTYKKELEIAIVYLNDLKMNCSIYNLPLCCIPETILGNYRKSISEWKNVYFEECRSCYDFTDCGGFFSSALEYKHEYIKPRIVKGG